MMLYLIDCEIAPGLRTSEIVAAFPDHKGRTHYLRIERDFLFFDKNKYYLPVSKVECGKGYTLVELPQEAETGVNRIWVKDEKIYTHK